MKNKNICVVGGAGFVGRHLLEILKESNNLMVVDVGSFNTKPYLHHLLNKDHYSDFLKDGYHVFKNNKYDYIFYLAGNSSVSKSAEDPIYDLQQSLFPLLNLLEIVKNKPTNFIFASSAACYGEMEKKKISYPVSPYGITKTAAENYLRYYHKNYNLPVLICRFFSLYGEYNKRQVVFDTVKRLLNNPKTVTIYNPKSRRDFIYIKDALNIVIILCKHKCFDAEIFDIGTGKALSILDMGKKIINLMKIEPNIFYKEIESKNDPALQIANIKTLLDKGIDINYDLDFNLKKTIDWVKENL